MDIGPSVLRSRTPTAASLGDAVPFMGDNLHFVSRAGGRVDGSRRYVGFTRARFREETTDACTLEEFSTWVETVAAELDAAKPGAILFSRFAAPTTTPADTKPLNILLDVDGLEETFIDSQHDRLDLQDTCVEVHELLVPHKEYKYICTVVANGKPREVYLRFDQKRDRYILRSSDLDTFTDSGNAKLTLVKRLNRGQAFRIIPATPQVVYAWRQFYSIDLRLKDADGRSLMLDLVTALPDLANISSEKGFKIGEFNNWPSTSLFGFIDF
jgi:hypothetical protein